MATNDSDTDLDDSNEADGGRRDGASSCFEDAMEDAALAPRKFKNCPIVRLREPTAGYTPIGSVLRLDYMSPLHSGEALEFETYEHRFSSGVKCSVADYDRRSESMSEKRRTSRPFAIGFADRIVFTTEEGEQAVFARPEVGISDEDEKESSIVEPLPDALVLFDPIEKRIIIATPDGDCLFMLRDGLLDVDYRGMIIG